MISTEFSNLSNKLPFNKKDISCRRFTVDEKHNWTTDESGDELTRLRKDRFIELAQAALEQAKREEEEKGLIQELIETLLEHTGAPMVADVILEQFRSQDVIERLAEDHFIQQKRRTSSNTIDLLPNTLKEPDQQQQETTKSITNNSSSILIISEYLWRLFRLLLLSSLVGLVYHFMCADPITYHQSLLSN
ncbi:hypothetical protein G6F37_011439 [Rhizopus arrhizus]|nr:hypothetical protein G6F38_011609 [Rhizopus arrhizus]KAG1149329.1 hypothetical protein G6F37_011439 [Rhizopus arrhizus]